MFSKNLNRILIVILVGGLLWAGIRIVTRNYLIQTFKISSSAKSMEPSLLAGDRIIVNKNIYMSSSPKRGDIVVYKVLGQAKSVIHRIVGLPNEKIEIRNGVVLIDGNPLQNPKIVNENIYYNDGNLEKGLEVKIPKGHYFLLGDNSLISKDSRYVGPIKREDIIGKAVQIYFPFNRWGSLYDRKLPKPFLFERLNAISGEVIVMRADYADNNKVRNISFYLPERNLSGEYKYECLSKEGEKVIFTFSYQNDVLQNLKLDTSFRPSQGAEMGTNVFTLLSGNKHDVRFIFTWNNDGSIKNINVEPEINNIN